MDINRNNYETFFLLYLDRELVPAEMQAVERFLGENPDLQKEFEILSQTVFMPVEMVFEKKESLLRTEEKRRIIPMYWLRIAAAVAVLVMGGWLIKTELAKNPAGEIARNRQAETNNSLNKEPSKIIAGSEKSNPANQVPGIAENKNPADQIGEERIAENNIPKKMSVQNKGVKNTVGANPGMKDQNNVTAKNKPDQQNQKANAGLQGLQSNEISEESLSAVQKSTDALEIQPAEMQAGSDPRQIAALPGTQAPTLLIAAANTKDPMKNENPVLKEPDYQTDNAISVVALNDRNKSITGFFKKLTKRAPADETTNNTRKVRVSVFQFSY